MIARLSKIAAAFAALAYPALARAQTGEAAVSGALAASGLNEADLGAGCGVARMCRTGRNYGNIGV